MINNYRWSLLAFICHLKAITEGFFVHFLLFGMCQIHTTGQNMRVFAKRKVLKCIFLHNVAFVTVEANLEIGIWPFTQSWKLALPLAANICHSLLDFPQMQGRKMVVERKCNLFGNKFGDIMRTEPKTKEYHTKGWATCPTGRNMWPFLAISVCKVPENYTQTLKYNFCGTKESQLVTKKTGSLNYMSHFSHYISQARTWLSPLHVNLADEAKNGDNSEAAAMWKHSWRTGRVSKYGDTLRNFWLCSFPDHFFFFALQQVRDTHWDILELQTYTRSTSGSRNVPLTSGLLAQCECRWVGRCPGSVNPVFISSGSAVTEILVPDGHARFRTHLRIQTVDS